MKLVTEFNLLHVCNLGKSHFQNIQVGAKDGHKIMVSFGMLGSYKHDLNVTYTSLSPSRMI